MTCYVLKLLSLVGILNTKGTKVYNCKLVQTYRNFVKEKESSSVDLSQKIGGCIRLVLTYME